ncbi:MAG: flavin reductase family protein [bacterium]|nr:flavin reductase family protein [bacterium]
MSDSLDPALIGLFVGKTTQMWLPMKDADTYCVNILAEQHGPVSNLFVGQESERFTSAAWEPGGDGAPGLDDVVAWIECKPYSITDDGEHDLILLEVTALRQGANVGPLTYHRGSFSGAFRSE